MPGRESRAVRNAVRCYRALLALYPREHRHRFKAEMEAAFELEIREARQQGRLAFARAFARNLAGAVAFALAEHVEGRTTQRGHVPAGPQPGKGDGWMSLLSQDLGYALRQLRREPAFFLLAAATLAMGIGASAAIFSVVDGVLLRSLPYHESERLVRIWSSHPEKGLRFLEHSYADYEAVRDQSRTLSGVAAFSLAPRDLRDEVAEPQRIEMARATPDLFSVIGVEPVLGRSFAPGEQDAVVLSYRFWQERYGGRDDALGQRLYVEDAPYMVVGVMPKSFSYPANTALWRSFSDDEYRDDDRELELVGRLASGVNVAGAAAEVAGIADRLARDFPETNEGYSAWAQPLREMLVRDVRTPLLTFLGAVAAVLLIACANVANLQLARGASRRAEMAVRSALGAPASRLVRQLLTENLLLAALGALGGLFLGNALLRLVLARVPSDLPRLAEVSLDARVVFVMVGVTTLAGIVFGWVPALEAARANPREALAPGSRGLLASRQRLQQGFVVAQVALATLLVTSAGLLISSFAHQLDVERGFAPDDLIAVTVSHPEWAEESGQLVAFYQDAVENLRGLPGTSAAVLASAHPMQAKGFRLPFELVDEGGRHRAVLRSVEPGYFRLTGISLLAGRDMSRDDTQGVAVVNEAFVRAFLPGGKPIGRRIRHPSLVSADSPDELEIVGVAANVRPDGMAEAAPQLYLPYRQAPWANMQVLIRTRENLAAITPLLRAKIWEVDPHVPVEVVSMGHVVSEQVAPSRFSMYLGGFFALLALALAATGIYGVMSYSVTRRTPELGLRIALGASGSDVFGMVLSRGLRLTLLGLGIGVTAAFGVSPWLRSLLFGIRTPDPQVLAVVVLVLGGVALLACLGPAVRALGVDPMNVLKTE